MKNVANNLEQHLIISPFLGCAQIHSIFTKIEVGPVMKDSSQEYDISFDEGENSLTTIHIPDANRIQAGFNFAAGMMFTLFPDQFLVAELDVNISHSFLANQSDVIYPVFGFQDNLRSRNLVLALNVAYLFGFDLVKNDKAPRESSKGKATKVRKKKMNKKKLEKKSLKYINRRNIKIYGN